MIRGRVGRVGGGVDMSGAGGKRCLAALVGVPGVGGVPGALGVVGRGGSWGGALRSDMRDGVFKKDELCWRLEEVVEWRLRKAQLGPLRRVDRSSGVYPRTRVARRWEVLFQSLAKRCRGAHVLKI